MNLTNFRPKMRGNVENKNNNPVNIRLVDKTSNIRNLWEHHIWYHVNISQVATLVSISVATCLLQTKSDLVPKSQIAVLKHIHIKDA